ncbi:MAG: toprim domain-containing protein, partial [Oscillospiraceae bacterium]|nr:toprim domain-containing protein [Oscillospiraceae bacterium]
MNHYTQQQILSAKRTDIVSFLASHGETTVRKGQESLWEKHQVWINGSNWFSYYENVGGHAIDFVQRFYGLKFPDAVRELIGMDAQECVSIPAQVLPPKEKKSLVLPERNPTMDRVTAYLTGERFVSPEIVSVSADAGILYESANHHDCVFVGVDENGNPRHCHKRSTGGDFKQTMPGSEAEFSFHYNGADDSIFVFEAPIDLLAYITLHPDGWQDHSYVALCSVADRALTHRLEVNPNLRKVFLCLDNDEAGQTAAERMKESLSERGYEVEILLPMNKDWDEDLKAANGVTPIPAGERNQTTHTTESEDYELNENTENLNANPKAADPIDELMAYAEPMEATMPSAIKTEDDLLAERLRKMYASEEPGTPEPDREMSSEAEDPAPVTTEDSTTDVTSASPVSGNDEGKVTVPPQNRLPEVPKAELAQDPDWRKSDPEVDPYVHPYYKYGDMLWYAKPIKDGETLVPLATFTPRLMTENTIHNTSEQKRVYEIGGRD